MNEILYFFLGVMSTCFVALIFRIIMVSSIIRSQKDIIDGMKIQIKLLEQLVNKANQKSDQ